jgi:hypothetical protein
MKKILTLLLFAGVALACNAAPSVELSPKTEILIPEINTIDLPNFQINTYIIMRDNTPEELLLVESVNETKHLDKAPSVPEPKIHPYLAKNKFKPASLMELKNRMLAVEGLFQSNFLELDVLQKAYLINPVLLEHKDQRFKYNYMLTLREYWLFKHEASDFKLLPAFRLLDQDDLKPIASWHPTLGFTFNEDNSLHPPYQKPILS